MDIYVGEVDITSVEATASGMPSHGHRKKCRRKRGITGDTSKAELTTGPKIDIASVPSVFCTLSGFRDMRSHIFVCYV